MSTKLKIKFFLFKHSVNALIFLSIGVFAFVLGKWFETITVMISYFILRYKFDDTFHHKNMWICVALSITMCFAMIALTLPINISILSGIAVGGIDCYILYKVRIYEKTKQELLELKEATKPKPFNLETATESELRDRCRELNFNEERTEFVVMAFGGKLSQKEIANILCVEEKAVQMRKWRLKKLLKE